MVALIDATDSLKGRRKAQDWGTAVEEKSPNFFYYHLLQFTKGTTSHQVAIYLFGLVVLAMLAAYSSHLKSSVSETETPRAAPSPAASSLEGFPSISMGCHDRQGRLA